MSRLYPTATLLALLLVGCLPPPKAALASSTLAQAPGVPSGQASPTVPTPPSAAALPGSRAGAIVLNFDNADIEALIQAVSDAVGFHHILAPDVRGRVTVHTAGAVGPEDAFSVLLSILEVNGFTAVKAGAIYKIVRTDTARQRAIPTFIGTMPEQTSPPGIVPPPSAGAEPRTPPHVPPAGSGVHAGSAPPHSGTATPPGATAAPPGAVGTQPIGPGTTPAPDQLVTHVVAPHFASASSLARVVGPLVSTRGSVIADPRANVLIVTDAAANVGRILEVVERLDVELAADEVHVIPLQFANANELASILNQVFAGAGPARPPIIIADPRTNSLVIRARRSDLEAIGRLLGRVD
jgi:general secretion pathway protein D